MLVRIKHGFLSVHHDDSSYHDRSRLSTAFIDWTSMAKIYDHSNRKEKSRALLVARQHLCFVLPRGGFRQRLLVYSLRGGLRQHLPSLGSHQG